MAEPVDLAAFATDDVDAARAAAQRAPVNSHDANGRTPLHVAATQASPAVVAELLRAGAYPNAVDHEGRTALLAAVEAGAPDETVATLRLWGADARHPDNAGRTPESVARDRGSAAFDDLAGPAPAIVRSGGDRGSVHLLVDG